MKAMILAAGYGRRLMPITNKIPKPLLKVGNQTLIERNINCLISSGFSEIIINVSHLSKLIINFVENTFPNQNILFSQEDQPLGTGGGILNALDLIGNETFLLTNSDIYHDINLKTLPKKTKVAHLVGVKNPEHNLNGDFSIENKNVFIKENNNDLTWSGISLVNPKIFRENEFPSNSFNIWDQVLHQYISSGLVTGQKSREMWIDVGTPKRLNLVNSAYNSDQ